MCLILIGYLISLIQQMAKFNIWLPFIVLRLLDKKIIIIRLLDKTFIVLRLLGPGNTCVDAYR